MGKFSKEAFSEAIEVIKDEFLLATWETVYVTLVATAFALLIGVPLGILLVAGDKKRILPIPKWVLSVIDFIINILRSIPFLILIIVAIPLTRLIVGTSVGTTASIVPLVIAAFPFIARLTESSLREVNAGVIDMAKSMGATPFQIIFKVMLPECLPSLISNFTIALTTILGYTAMSGTLGGGGLGKIAINYGYYRYRTIVLIAAVILLVALVQILQSLGTHLAKKVDKRLKKN